MLHSVVLLLSSTFSFGAEDSLAGVFTDSAAIPAEFDTLEAVLEQAGELDESAAADILESLIDQVSGKPFVQMRSRFARKLQPSRGFLEDKYIGSPVKSYQRLRVFRDPVGYAGVLVEKDAGEARYNDFTSGYLVVNAVGPVMTLLVGDYVVEAGQGIALWRGFDFAKGADVVLPVKRQERGVVPYASSDENRFLRGVAGTIDLPNVSASLFLSKKKLNATLDSTGGVTSLYSSGYFRTATEVEKRGSLSEFIIGFRGAWALDARYRVGITGYTARYSRDLRFSNPGFTGRALNLIAADYSVSFGELSAFGEWGLSNSSLGGIAGLHADLGTTADLVATYRDYSVSFFNLHGYGFGERGSNERGWYLGIRHSPARHVRLSGYYDQFTFPEHTGSTLFSGGGREVFVQAEVRPASRLLLSARYRTRIVEERTSVGDQSGRTIRFDDQHRRRSYRLSADYGLNSRTKLRSRLEYNEFEAYYSHRKENGFMFYQDIVLQLLSRVGVNARVVMFRTEGFDSGIGEYERDLPGVLTIPIVYGRGVRWYLLSRYTPVESLAISLKYSELIRDDLQTIGNGLDEIQSHIDNRVGLQIDFSF